MFFSIIKTLNNIIMSKVKRIYIYTSWQRQVKKTRNLGRIKFIKDEGQILLAIDDNVGNDKEIILMGYSIETLKKFRGPNDSFDDTSKRCLQMLEENGNHWKSGWDGYLLHNSYSSLLIFQFALTFNHIIKKTTKFIVHTDSIAHIFI